MIDTVEMSAIMQEMELLKQILLLRLDLLCAQEREWANGLKGMCEVHYSKSLVDRTRAITEEYQNKKREIIDQLNALDD